MEENRFWVFIDSLTKNTKRIIAVSVIIILLSFFVYMLVKIDNEHTNKAISIIERVVWFFISILLLPSILVAINKTNRLLSKHTNNDNWKQQ